MDISMGNGWANIWRFLTVVLSFFTLFFGLIAMCKTNDSAFFVYGLVGVITSVFSYGKYKSGDAEEDSFNSENTHLGLVYWYILLALLFAKLTDVVMTNFTTINESIPKMK